MALLLNSGKSMQTIIDSNLDPTIDAGDGSAKYFDIIGFDPRGVNNTTPGVSCFPDEFSRLNWDLQQEAEGMLGSGSDSLTRNWQRSLAFSQSCSDMISKTEDGEEALGEHVNTVAVVEDMVAIIERHGEWREKQGLLAMRRSGYDPALARRTAWKKGKEKLLYWGISYGTILGGTFATMHPNRIERAVLDAVVNIEYYYTGKGESNLKDADSIFNQFSVYCEAVGPDLCGLYIPGGSAAIKHSIVDLLETIRTESVAVMASTSRGPEVVTWTDVMNLVRVSMYMPLKVFPVVGRILGDLRKGDGSAMADFKQEGRTPSCASTECQNADAYVSECSTPGGEPMTAILCTDADRLTGGSLDDFSRSWQSLQNDSYVLGNYWASLVINCAGWKSKAKWSFEGCLQSHSQFTQCKG